MHDSLIKLITECKIFSVKMISTRLFWTLILTIAIAFIFTYALFIRNSPLAQYNYKEPWLKITEEDLDDPFA
jgi:hypothetical protein